jgi:hypothetical protein
MAVMLSKQGTENNQSSGSEIFHYAFSWAEFCLMGAQHGFRSVVF